MNRTFLLSAAILAITSSFVTEARADPERGPFFVEGHVTGVTVAIPPAGVGLAYPLELDFGYHVFGSHEGFVVGLAQRFDLGLTGASTGATAARVGWDFAIPISEMELTIAPFLQGGVLYAFAGGDPGGLVGAGVEGRLFPFPVMKTVEGERPVKTKRVEVQANRIDIKEKIQFKANEAVIEEVSFPLLREIADVIKANPHIRRLRIEGHASSEGDSAVNQRLSENRAKAVLDHLVNQGSVDAGVLESEGFGDSKPIADNESEEGREKNRRVEFNIVEQDKVVTKEVVQTSGGAEEGFFVVLKPIEVDLAFAAGEVRPVPPFPTGVGYAL